MVDADGEMIRVAAVTLVEPQDVEPAAAGDLDQVADAPNAWGEMDPRGRDCVVEQATVEDAKYQYRIQIRYDSTDVDNLMGGSILLWHDEALPPVVLLDMDVLNAEGKSIRDLGGGSFTRSASYGGSNNQATGTESGSGSCDACGSAPGRDPAPVVGLARNWREHAQDSRILGFKGSSVCTQILDS